METWKEWGRSLDLKDASPTAQIWGDLWLLSAVQALPLIVVSTYLLLFPLPPLTLSPHLLLLALNLFLLVIRFGMLLAIAPSYDRHDAKGGWLFWLSPLADPIAVLRIFLSAFRTPKEWRGRQYS